MNKGVHQAPLFYFSTIMKYSRYNFIYKIAECKFVLYNLLSDKILVLLPDMVSLLKTNKHQPQALREIHPDFYNVLLENRFIVKLDCDEYGLAIERFIKKDADRDIYSITINPTLDCNLHCWYCYEKHIPQSKMSPDVYSNILALIRKHVIEKNISISFFGGEPLLSFEDIIIPLLEEVKRLCDTYSKKLFVSFTTNGTLLTDNKLQRLLRFTSDINFQIALDGGESYHDKVKFFHHTSKGTYRSTIDNIKNVVRNKLPVIVRCNFTHITVESFLSVLHEFANLPDEDKKFLYFDFHRIWQDKDAVYNRYIKEQFKKIVSFGKETDLEISDGEKSLYMGHKCYADDNAQVLVNYNGDLYKCTAQDFTANNCVGQLAKNGELVFNDKYKKFLSNSFPNKACAKCKIFPLCMGGCYKVRMTTADLESCPLAYSPSLKRNIIRRRIQFLLS